MKKGTNKPHILIAAKETKQEFFARKYGTRNLLRACSEQEQDVRRIKTEHAQHHANLKDLIAAFQAHGLAPIVRSRVAVKAYAAYTSQDIKQSDLIVSFGGDGEVLDLARYIRKKPGQSNPLLWIEKADPSSKAALAVQTATTYADKVARWLSGDFTIENWKRVQGTLRIKKRILVRELALNEIYFGDLYAMGTARYCLKLNRQQEYQMSSGGLISTQVGLQGWLWNIIPPDEKIKRIPPDFTSPILEFAVREPTKYSRQAGLLRGRIRPGEKIIVISAMNYDGVVSFDASKPHYDHSRCYEFNRGRILEVSVSRDSLRVLRF
ncbi:MAG: hypothetical protein EHM45_09155 [Desulfobacteraceae bacterium]|nr:MAG: hypothetical protein EHM45_09155 [Desulfobacteraceae bacterium]